MNLLTTWDITHMQTLSSKTLFGEEGPGNKAVLVYSCITQMNSTGDVIQICVYVFTIFGSLYNIDSF